MPVEVGGVNLSHLTRVVTAERARMARHPVPGMSGDLAQTLGRPSIEVELSGIFYGPNALDDLQRLRAAYFAEAPVDLVIDAVDDSAPVQPLGFTQVLIAALEVTQRAGYPAQFDFPCPLLEYVEPPRPAAPDVFAG